MHNIVEATHDIRRNPLINLAPTRDIGKKGLNAPILPKAM